MYRKEGAESSSTTLEQGRQTMTYLPGICFPIRRIQYKGTSILATGRGEKAEGDILHFMQRVLVEDLIVDDASWRSHYVLCAESFASVSVDSSLLSM